MNPCCAFDRVVSEFHTEDKVSLDLGYPRIPFTVQSWTNLAITTFLSWLAMLGHLQIASPKKCVFDSGLPTYFQNLTKTKVLDETLTNISPRKRPFWRCFCWCQGGIICSFQGGYMLRDGLWHPRGAPWQPLRIRWRAPLAKNQRNAGGWDHVTFNWQLRTKNKQVILHENFQH